MLGKEGSVQDLPPAPLPYKILQWARDMKVSYPEVLRMHTSRLQNYLTMRELEDEFGPASARPPRNTDPPVPPGAKQDTMVG